MNHRTTLLIAIVILSLGLTSCKASQVQSPGTQAPPTPTATSVIVAVTDTPPPAPTAVPTAGDELCDNTYFPSDDDATWVYSGNNSKLGDYKRTDTIVDSRDDGFTMGTILSDVSYTVEFICTEAGLIAMDPMQSQMTAVFSGPAGQVGVTTTGISGLTFPRDIQPEDTWQQVVDWSASTGGSGQYIFQYTAMGLEVVTVPIGTFDAMRLDVVIQVEIGGVQGTSGVYTTSLWLVRDIGIVKNDGRSQIRSIDFTDTIDLISYDSP